MTLYAHMFWRLMLILPPVYIPINKVPRHVSQHQSIWFADQKARVFSTQRNASPVVLYLHLHRKWMKVHWLYHRVSLCIFKHRRDAHGVWYNLYHITILCYNVISLLITSKYHQYHRDTVHHSGSWWILGLMVPGPQGPSTSGCTTRLDDDDWTSDFPMNPMIQLAVSWCTWKITIF